MLLTPRTVIMIAAAIAAIIAAASAVVAVSRSPQQISRSVLIEPPSSGTAQVSTVVIAPGDSASTIGRLLRSHGAVDSQTRFELLALLMDWEHRLEAGEYSFEPALPTFEVLRRIHSGETSPQRVIIPEGLRIEQVIERLAAAEVSDSASLAAVISDGRIGEAGRYAAQRPAGASLEGYLFPADYRFSLEASPLDVTVEMLQRLDEAITPEIARQAAARGATMHQILTIASIIEREAAVEHERRLISAVIWNRLAAGMPLQMNSTIQYAVGQPSNWWKAELSDADLVIDSPYNSYRYSGLPPTPIASPGLPSIEAAADPDDAPYLYFVAKGDGTHAFSLTYEEHLDNVERYLGGSE